MSGFVRQQVSDVGVQTRLGRQGDGFPVNPNIVTAADGAYQITVSDIANGVVQMTPTAGRAVTMPTAAALLAAFPNMDIGDTLMFVVSSLAAFALTMTANTGVTVAGRTTANNSATIYLLTRTAAATFTVNGL